MLGGEKKKERQRFPKREDRGIEAKEVIGIHKPFCFRTYTRRGPVCYRFEALR